MKQKFITLIKIKLINKIKIKIKLSVKYLKIK